MKETLPSYWSLPSEALMAGLASRPEGLGIGEARERLARYGPNQLEGRSLVRPFALLASQFKSPLVLILLFAAVISLVTGEFVDAIIVLVIVVAGALLGFVQEYSAGSALEKMRKRVTHRVSVRREDRVLSIPAAEVVPGDIVLLSAGSLIPADGVVLQADDFFVNQAVLTGETFPVEKQPGAVAPEAGLTERVNCAFMGTNVRSGFASLLVVETGQRTVFGGIAGRLNLGPGETEFERGIRRFGALLTQVMTILVLIVFAVNVVLEKPAIDSLLFAVALAVGIAPELLPAIISITLSKGAMNMSKRGVIVRQLSALENFGSMDVLCTDKTGTLTVGVVQLDEALDTLGQPSQEVFVAAYLNACFQTGLANPLDEAITARPAPDISRFVKTEEIPYDFGRKRLSIAVRDNTQEGGLNRLITKGAFATVLDCCSFIRAPGAGTHPLDEERKDELERLFSRYSGQGYRVLGLAEKAVLPRDQYTQADESEMTFTGFLLFFDPPKADAATAIRELRQLGISLKIITGDNRQVAQHVARAVDLDATAVVTGPEINRLNDEAFWQVASSSVIFAEVDPHQKERIITALQKTGHVVGYLGDGINDAPALHAADVGISVDSAVDIAKETASFVLLEHSLGVLREGILEGRRTFANTLKYVFTTTSANFGNMLSMAGLSIFVPFLPLLPKQILLNNFLSDFPAMALANDTIDAEFIERPRRWDVRLIRDFMIVFGLISTVFDYLTFGVLLLVLKVGETEFRTAWFIESLFTELVILLIVRTQRPIWQSRPGRLLWVSTLLVGVATLLLPYLPWTAGLFGFVPLPVMTLGWLGVITLGYAVANEVGKRWFLKPG